MNLRDLCRIEANLIKHGVTFNVIISSDEQKDYAEWVNCGKLNCMPVIFRYEGFRFFFFSNEGNPLEPCHIHIRKGEAIAKFWITPEVKLAESYGLSSTELRKLHKITYDNKKLIEEKWHEYFKT